MTEKAFYQDSYLKQLTANVVAIEENRLILDQTIFYPSGGGQPGDQGDIRWGGQSIPVLDTKYSPDRQTIVHFLPENCGVELKVGQEVELVLDWTRRHRLMRMHTAMHLLCSIIPYPVTGGGVGEEESRVEFDMETTEFDKEALSATLNEIVSNDLPINIEFITDQQLDENPDLVRTMSVQPPRGTGTIRMINVGDKLDYQPCGGTHVKSTGEIGPLQITKIKSKGKQNKRVNIALLEP